MKKSIIILAALAMVAVACNKADSTKDDAKMVNVNLRISLDQELTKCNFSLTDPSDPIGGMTVTWKENDILTLFVFQGDNASWTSNYIFKQVNMPAAAEGLTSYDVSPLFGALDLTGFDGSKNLKYIVTLTTSYTWNEVWKQFSIYNGIPYIYHTATMSKQINSMGMIAETDVQEIPFPGSSTLDLEGSLHWITSVLAVQFNIDPAADITYPSDSYLSLIFTGSRYVDCYTPVTKETDIASSLQLPIYFSAAAKLSDALDGNNCRYYTIPADNMTDEASQKLGGSSFYFKKGSDELPVAGSIDAGATILGGKVYGLKIHVTDSDSNGVPEFTKM